MAVAPSTLSPPTPIAAHDARARPALHLATSRSAVIRLAPIVDALQALSMPQTVVDVARPDGSPPPAPGAEPTTASTAAVAAATEAAIARTRPATVFLAGDGEAAVTAALVCARLGTPIARVGAGLRCGDRGIREEINRIVLDGLADRLYVDGEDAADHLREEGVDERRIRRVGTTLGDVVARRRPLALARTACRQLGLPAGRYVLAALHRPENLRDDERLARIVEALSVLAGRAPVVLCLHAATRAAMAAGGDLERLRAAGVELVGALDHTDFLSLQATAGAVVTDSAGVQEETTLLGVPCFTARRATERTVTLTHGTNVLLGEDPREIADVPVGTLAGPLRRIALWDGGTAQRIARDFA